jgi:hypothetical protein
MKKMLCILISFALIAGSSQANAQTAVRKMDFSTCLKLIRSTAADLGAAPVNIVETKTLRIVRFVTDDGSVLMTCSGPDQKMILKMTKQR